MPTAGVPAVTIALIALSVGLHLGGWAPDLTGTWWLWAALASLLISASLLGLVVNMLFLWLFAESLEGLHGRVRLAALVLLAGIAAAGAQELADPDVTAPSVGIAGSIAGLIAAYALTLPHARILCWVLIPFFITFVEIPALIIAAVWFPLQAVPEIGQPPLAGLAGGLGVGLAAGRLLARSGRGVAAGAREAMS